jgi:hypothetical protein
MENINIKKFNLRHHAKKSWEEHISNNLKSESKFKSGSAIINSGPDEYVLKLGELNVVICKSEINKNMYSFIKIKKNYDIFSYFCSDIIKSPEMFMFMEEIEKYKKENTNDPLNIIIIAKTFEIYDKFLSQKSIYADLKKKIVEKIQSLIDLNDNTSASKVL